MRLQGLIQSAAHRPLWWTARLGAWLIRISVTWSPRGGASVVSLVVGEDAYGRCWHRGTSGQSRAVAILAREEAKILDGQAILLDEIGDMTEPL